MKCRIMSVFILPYFLWGCASPFQSTWYVVENIKTDKSSTYLAILNRSSSAQQINNVILNKISGNDRSGLRLDGIDRKIYPGQIIIKDLTNFRAASGNNNDEIWTCRIPVSVIIETGPSGAQIKADMISTLPSSVPIGWEKECSNVGEPN